jgi:Tfp pilus assembly protein PilN
MIEINLLRGQKISRRGLPRISLSRLPVKLEYLVAVGLVSFLLLLFAVIAVYQRAQIGQVRSRIARATEEKAKLQDAVRLVNQLSRKQNEVAVKLELIRQLDQNRFFEARLVSDISNSLPEYLWLTAVREAPPIITLEGMAFSSFLIANFMDNLSKSSNMRGVDLVSLEKGEFEGKEVIKFTLVASLVQDLSTGPAGPKPPGN